TKPQPSNSALMRAMTWLTWKGVLPLPSSAASKSFRCSARGRARCGSQGATRPTFAWSAFARRWRSIVFALDRSAERGFGLPPTVAYHLRDRETCFVAPGAPGLERRPSGSSQRTICFLKRRSSRGSATVLLLGFGFRQGQPQSATQLAERPRPHVALALEEAL